MNRVFPFLHPDVGCNAIERGAYDKIRWLQFKQGHSFFEIERHIVHVKKYVAMSGKERKLARKTLEKARRGL